MADFIFALAKSIHGVHILWGNNYPVCDSSSAHILFLKAGRTQRIRVSSSENRGQGKHDFPWAGTQLSRHFLGW